jgi:iron(III)-enterobactin esterase
MVAVPPATVTAPSAGGASGQSMMQPAGMTAGTPALEPGSNTSGAEPSPVEPEPTPSAEPSPTEPEPMAPEPNTMVDASVAMPDAGEPDPQSNPEAEPAGPPELPDPGTEGDGDYEVGPNYSTQPALSNQGNPQGRRFQFSMRLADSEIFDGTDSTLDPSKPVNQSRGITVYVPAQYQDGTPAPVLVIQDGDGPIGMVSTALDNLTVSNELPAFVAVAVQNGGNDAQGSERGLEYDTMSDRYARFIDEEVLPAVEADSALRQAYPNFSFTKDPSGRAALGCSSGGAAAFTMAWFRPDLFSRVVAYSTTLVDQQDYDAPENAMYPDGAWDYHSELEVIANSEKKPIRVFLNVNENDLRANDPESTFHNWVMANQRTAAALAAKDYHYRFVYGLGRGHCDQGVQQASLADALIWVWRGYEPSGE